jgi:potassium efflux system protein
MLEPMVTLKIRKCHSNPDHILVRFLVVATVALCLLYNTVSAQQTPAPETKIRPQSEIPSQPAPIPLSQISSRSDETAALLEEIRNRPLPDARADSIAKNVSYALGYYQHLIELTDSRLTGSISVRRLNDIERRWNRAGNNTAQWRDHMGRRARLIDRDLETLNNLRLVWEITLARTLETDAQESLLGIIRTTLKNTVAEEKRIGEQRAEVLLIQQKLLDLESVINGAHAQIASAEKASRHRLAQFDSKPLWISIYHRPLRVFHPQQIVVVWTESIRDLKEFAHHYQDWLWIHVFMFFVVLALIVSLRKRELNIGENDTRLENTARVLSRPISAALVITLSMTYLGYKTAPSIVHELASVLLFIPLLRILPEKTFRKFRGLLFLLFVIYALVRIMDWIPYEALLRRLLLLLLTTMFFLTLLKFARINKRSDETLERNVSRPERPIVKGAAVLVVVAFLSNIIGNVSLADVIVIAIVFSSYWALILYAFYLVFDKLLNIGLRTQTAGKLRIVRWHKDMVHSRIMGFLKIVAAISWVYVVLTLLQIWPAASLTVRRILTARANFGDLGVSLGGLLGFGVTVWASFMISRVLRFILEEDVFPRLPLGRGVPHALSISLHYVILLFGFLLAVAATGADLGKFSLMAGALGVGIGFGLQNIVNNFISGLVLIAERPIMPGDTIEVSGMMGEVKRIGMRSSTVRTWQGAEVIVPNANLISNEVTNWTLSDRQRRLDIPVGVAYGSDVNKVMQLLKDVVVGHPDIMDTPEPNVLFQSFGDSSLDFELRVWTAKFAGFQQVRSEIIVAIEKALKEAGIVIPFPQRDLHLKTVDPNAGNHFRGDGPDSPASG